MLVRNIVALILTIFSLIILYPGLTIPILEITVAAELPILGKTTFFEQTQSILETIETLNKTDNRFVAGLIFLFSVIIPVLKGILVIFIVLIKHAKLKYKTYRLVYAIGKWSMADVFAVAVFISFLSAQSNNAIQAVIHDGFYYFVAYCLVSLLGIQFLKVTPDAKQ